MPEQRIGTCSECGGSVYGWVGGWMATVPPPPPRCRDCGAVSVVHDPVIPMRKPAGKSVSEYNLLSPWDPRGRRLTRRHRQ